MRRLMLTGFMGVGKTSVGRRIGERMGKRFVDLDAAIEAEAGASVAEVFRENGEASFRELERRMLERVLVGDAEVVALGGGALIDTPTRRRVLADCCLVNLTASPQNIIARIATGQERPLIGTASDASARIHSLMTTRRDGYAESHFTVATDDIAIDDVARAIIDVWSRDVLAVPLGPRTYRVEITETPGRVVGEQLDALRPSKSFVITDKGAEHCARDLVRALDEGGRPTELLTVEAQEAGKTLSGAQAIIDRLMDLDVDRSALLIAVGGGVISDMVGFVASILFRGVRWLSVPTTLLAMVDASVGGKTGVDHRGNKNVLGTFYQPQAVVIRPSHTDSQSPRGYAGGLAEVCKVGLLCDPDLFAILEDCADPSSLRRGATRDELIRRSIVGKILHVADDEHDLGRRRQLNFGHTLGHALESAGRFERWSHGEAIAMGMVAELAWGVAMGITDADLPSRVAETLKRLGLPFQWPEVRAEEIGLALLRDKKRASTVVQVVTLATLGKPLTVPVPTSDFMKWVGDLEKTV